MTEARLELLRYELKVLTTALEEHRSGKHVMNEETRARVAKAEKKIKKRLVRYDGAS